VAAAGAREAAAAGVSSRLMRDFRLLGLGAAAGAGVGGWAAAAPQPPGAHFEFPEAHEAEQLRLWQQQHEQVLQQRDQRTTVRVPFDLELLPEEPPPSTAWTSTSASASTGDAPAGQAADEQGSSSDSDSRRFGGAGGLRQQGTAPLPAWAQRPAAGPRGGAEAASTPPGPAARRALQQEGGAGGPGGASALPPLQAGHTPPRLALFSPLPSAAAASRAQAQQGEPAVPAPVGYRRL
jgi:hypothetical protein